MKTDNDLISIIIPVYNTCDYLSKCLDSVINQTHQNIEIIILNDGSTDSSKDLIDEYVKKDSRIKAIHLNHSGVAIARNTGLDLVKGEYIGFVDSDDYIEKDMYECLYNLIRKHNADISMITFCKIRDNQIIEENNSNKTICLNKEEFMKELLALNKIKAHFPNKLFKKELFVDIRIPTNVNYEDDAIIFKLAERINKFVLYEKSKYYYCQRNNSITNDKIYKTQKDFYDVTFDNYLFIKKNHPKLEDYAAFYLIDSLIMNYVHCINNDLEKIVLEIEKQIPLIKELLDKYSNTILKELQDYKKCVLFALIWNKEYSRKYTKEIWKEYMK